MKTSLSTHDHLRTAAAELFHKEGFRPVSTELVAEHAGVTKVTLYKHFSSKRNLLMAGLGLRQERRDKALAVLQASSSIAAADALLRFFDWLAQWHAADSFRGCAFVNATAEVGSELKEVRLFSATAKSILRQKLVDLAKQADARNPDVIGLQLLLLAEGATTLAMLEQHPRFFESARRAAMVLMANDGIKVPPVPTKDPVKKPGNRSRPNRDAKR